MGRTELELPGRWDREYLSVFTINPCALSFFTQFGRLAAILALWNASPESRKVKVICNYRTYARIAQKLFAENGHQIPHGHLIFRRLTDSSDCQFGSTHTYLKLYKIFDATYEYTWLWDCEHPKRFRGGAIIDNAPWGLLKGPSSLPRARIKTPHRSS